MRKIIAASAIALMFPIISSAKPKEQPAPEPAPAAQMAPAPALADPKMAIAEKIKADWPKYDEGAKGHLNRAELAKWLADLRTAAGQPAPDAEWQKSAFVQTDTNSDTNVSVEELISFLTAGA
jgi:hypothetical protein